MRIYGIPPLDNPTRIGNHPKRYKGAISLILIPRFTMALPGTNQPCWKRQSRPIWNWKRRMVSSVTFAMTGRKSLSIIPIIRLMSKQKNSGLVRIILCLSHNIVYFRFAVGEDFFRRSRKRNSRVIIPENTLRRVAKYMLPALTWQAKLREPRMPNCVL
jgi:hypothetical protein